MGRYFGLANHTKKQRISNYWKNSTECDIYAVMHRYNWSHTDKIVCGSYESHYRIEFTVAGTDANGNAIIKKEVSRIECYCDEETENDKNNDECCDCYNHGFFNSDKINIAEWKKLGMGFDFGDYNVADHCPQWENGVCQICNYSFDPFIIQNDAKNFDGTFHFN
jgi:hypothetical protein